MPYVRFVQVKLEEVEVRSGEEDEVRFACFPSRQFQARIVICLMRSVKR
jgi:hypothetical protein